MTREEIFGYCKAALTQSNCLLMELATGTGKTKLSIDLVNWISNAVYKSKKPKMLLLVAKTEHKYTWKEEFEKWGGIQADVTTECYESLKKHQGEFFDFIVMDEVHHIKSDIRLDLLSTLRFNNMIGLSGTIPFGLKRYFKYRYHSQIVSCDVVEAIEEEILPEPEIILYPLTLNNTTLSETWEINPKSKGAIAKDLYTNIWKYKKTKQHAILSCTPKQKLNEMNAQILWYKNRSIASNNAALKNIWLHMAGQRLEFLAFQKNSIVLEILKRLSKYRTITFCKTIEQCELLGKNCIHSKNSDAHKIYEKFNQKKINHITAVNILNENANLVDCKYAIFANLSSSEIIMPQRIGRSLRHKHPTIIVPYYKDTREQEIVEKVFENYNKKFIRTISSIEEI